MENKSELDFILEYMMYRAQKVHKSTQSKVQKHYTLNELQNIYNVIESIKKDGLPSIIPAETIDEIIEEGV